MGIKIRNGFRAYASVAKRFIGVDLGTTNSCVAFLDSGRPVVIENSDGSRTTPSVVAFTSDGSVLVGAIARRQSISNPENTVSAVKRLIGRRFDDKEIQKNMENFSCMIVQSASGDAWVRLQGKDYSPSQISSFILEHLKKTAESHLDCVVENAVITVPAYFNDSQRQATKDAGQLAGLNVLRVVNEPTAAALAYGISKSEDKTIAVYDLGGGTFDISILQIQKGVFEVRATNGDTMLGGEDFDARLTNRIVEEARKITDNDIKLDSAALQRIKEASEAAKIALSTELTTKIALPFIASNKSGSVHLNMDFSRRQFEDLMNDLILRTVAPCEQACFDASIQKADINEVILVGGMTRIPKVRETVKRIFGRETASGVNPDEAVAIGAAIQAGVLAGEVGDILLLDVTPLSLGIETLGGAMDRLISRNTTIPTRVAEVFSTAVDNQTQVEINVYQGENDLAHENKLLGNFTLMDIPPMPRGVPRIEVSFDLDSNGILNVSAKDQKTGKEQRIVLNPIGGLSKADISAMLAAKDHQPASSVFVENLAQQSRLTKSLAEDILQKLDQYASKLNAIEVDELRSFCRTVLSRVNNTDVETVDSLRAIDRELQDRALAIFKSSISKESVK